MVDKIAVLGAGGTGYTIAADLTLAGHNIILFEEPPLKQKLTDVIKRGGIEIKGASRQGFARIHMITTDVGEAIREAKVILVSVVASRHERIAEICAPHLKNGQTIVIGPGNAGSIVFTNKFQQMGLKSKITIAEIEGNYYPNRLIGPAEVIVALPTKDKYISAFPAKDTGKVIEALKGIYQCRPATNVLETTLNAGNVHIHLAASLLNAGSIEKSGGKYYLYKEGLTPAIFRCIEAVVAEKQELFKVLGYTNRYRSEFLEKVSQKTEFPELDIFRSLIGPTSMQHRYITEDASTGQVIIVTLGEMLKVPTPVCKAMVIIASAINQIDYLKEGRTIQQLGLDGMNVSDLNKYLEEGYR